MGEVRAARPADVRSIAALHRKSFGEASHLPRRALEEYLLEVLFRGPWQDEERSSLVYETEQGRLAGFLGLFDRPMRLNGRRLRATVSTQLVADPDVDRPQIPFQLMSAALDSDSDMVFTDAASHLSREIWVASGGETVLSLGGYWVRPLRPVSWLTDFVGRRSGWLSGAARAARPLSGVLDSAARQLRPDVFGDADISLRASSLTPEIMCRELPRLLGDHALVPEYDLDSLEWHFRRLEEKREVGDISAVHLYDESGETVGWHLYYPSEDGAAEVVQVASLPSRRDQVLRHLFGHARERGAIALRGRVNARMLDSYVRNHCLFYYEGPWTMMSSDDPEVRAAVHSGDAWLSRLEGEWWMRFLGDATQATPAAARRET